MARGPLRFSETDLARVMRVAKKVGAASVAVDRAGTINIDLSVPFPVDKAADTKTADSEVAS